MARFPTINNNNSRNNSNNSNNYGNNRYKFIFNFRKYKNYYGSSFPSKLPNETNYFPLSPKELAK